MKEVRRPVTEVKSIYIAEDGKEFTSMLDCEEYEWELRQKAGEEMAEGLRADLNKASWPSIANPYSKHEFHWFLIQNEEDLKTFCKAYSSYDRSLKDIENVKRYVSYPDYICLVDYLNGPEEPEWFTLTRMLSQVNAFVDQLPSEFLEKERPDGCGNQKR